MRSDVVLIVAIVSLAILGVFISYTQPEASKLLYVIVSIIGGIAGVSIPKVVSKIRKRKHG